MKTKPNLFNVRLVLWAVTLIGLALATTLPAATNTPATEVVRSKSTVFSTGGYVYSMRFPGGTVSEFFKFMRANGFTNDSILFGEKAGDVYLPKFTVSNVQLKEVAKSIEFVAEGKLIVELVEAPYAGDVNVWRIKLAEPMVSAQLKTRACAVPYLLSGTKGKERVGEIVEQVVQALANGTERLYRNQSSRPQGDVTIIESEKIVVAVGTEAYVEAMSSVLEAAEKVRVATHPQ